MPSLKCLIFRPIAILKWSDGNRTVPVEYCGGRTVATILLTLFSEAVPRIPVGAVREAGGLGAHPGEYGGRIGQEQERRKTGQPGESAP